jgi:hypothetical protein
MPGHGKRRRQKTHSRHPIIPPCQIDSAKSRKAASNRARLPSGLIDRTEPVRASIICVTAADFHKSAAV